MRVLVTRPDPGASHTAELLRASGHEPVLLPMTRLVDLLKDGTALNDQHAGAYAVTSANGVRSWQALGVGAECLERPLYSVGERTGAAAREAGFKIVRSGDGDGAALATRIVRDARSGLLQLSEEAPLVYAAGRTRHPQFEAALSAHEIPVSVVELYDIERISYSTDLLNQAIQAQPPDMVLLYSRKAAEVFFRTIAGNGLINLLKDCRFICMSDNVADEVPAEFTARTAVAKEPDEENLLALLDRGSELF